MLQKAYKKFLNDFKKLPERKQYIEFFTAILTVPVLLTVIILNVNNLRQDDKETTPTPPAVREIVITQPSGQTVPQTTDEPCNKAIGPISITNPTENEVVTENPVMVSISYRQGDFCSVVWSYRINNGRWSDYGDTSVALYNPPQGNIKFDLRVKSVVTGEEEMVTRNFVYRGSGTVPTESPQASSSAQ